MAPPYKAFSPFRKKWQNVGLQYLVYSHLNSILIMPKRIRKQVVLKDFQIEYKLGEGAYGQVYLASLEGEEYAIKEMSKSKLSREHREYTAMVEKQVLKILDHPGIAKPYHAFQNTQNLYLVMEYCSDNQLSSIIDKRLLKEDSRAFYFAELVNIMEYLHAHKIVHRDLKPSNLLLSRQGHLKLIDFGTADISNSDLLSEEFKLRIGQLKGKSCSIEEEPLLRKRSTFVGTADYISPELIQFSLCTPSSDLWAMGCILYYSFYGQAPFTEPTQLQNYQVIKMGKVQYPEHQDVSAEGLDLMRKLLVKDPMERIGSGSRQELSYSVLKKHPFFKGIDIDSIFGSTPPVIDSSQHQIQEKLAQLKLQANLSYKEPHFDNILEKLLVKIDEDREGIYQCHFKKIGQLEEFQKMQGEQRSVYKLKQDGERKVAHLLSQSKFSIGIESGERLIYSSRDSAAICSLLNKYYDGRLGEEVN